MSKFNGQNGHAAPEEKTQQARKNQFGDYDDGKMTIEKWVVRWEKGQTKFHKTDVHPMLLKHYKTMTGGKKGLRIFMPLCGKSLDMNWLSEQGHHVLGCEAVELGCKQFYEENNIPYNVTPLETISGKVFKSTDDKRKVTLYCCDYFLLTPNILGSIDCIWDRGSLAAIDVEDREKYISIILSLMRKNTSYMLDHFMVDNTTFVGPPYNFDTEDVKKHFGCHCETQFLEESDAMTDWQRSWGITSFTELVHLLYRV